jgi:hypothetical protein
MNYLGELKRTLGDLTGYSILAFELIQNADDAGASQLVFTFTEKALEVWNDGVFSDCGHQDLPPDDCPMLESHEHRCDFHAFREVSSEDKRRRGHTIGAFGIGFTAVYQVTDRPELISVGRHWIVDEGKPETERIGVCDGCPKCDSDSAGTTFVLPWAFDSDSYLRDRLAAPAMSLTGIDELRRELLDVLPTTVLFLQNLNELGVRDGDEPAGQVERLFDEDRLLVQVNDRVESWVIFDGSFPDRAADLRAKHGGKIEDSRHDDVQIAIPLEHAIDGRLCAYLPTRHSTGLPFHVNADFFPASDRTRLPDEGFRGEWNREAIRAAARAVAERLVDLRDLLGPKRLWEMILAAWRCRSEDGTGEGGQSDWLGSFWSEMVPFLAETPIFYTSGGEWVRPSDGVTINQLEDERLSLPFLEWLGLHVVHPDLHAIIYSGLPRADVLRIRELNLALLVETLHLRGLAGPEQPDLPDGIVEQAWHEIEILLRRRGADPELLQEVALAPTRHAGLIPFSKARRTDPAAQQLFSAVIESVPFLDEETLKPVAPSLVDQIEPFLARDAVDLLEQAGGNIGAEIAPEVIRWFSDRAGEVDQQLGGRLAALPIFPTTSSPKPLVDLSIPGGYPDELGLAELVDLKPIPFADSFLRQLGASELTIGEYALRIVPSNVDVAESDPDRWRRVVELLAHESGALRDDQDVWATLSELPLVETETSFVAAGVAYFPSSELDVILVDYPAAEPPTHESVVGFYEWLGVTRQPRPSDILTRIEALTAHAPTPQSVRNVEAIVRYLAESKEALEATTPALSRKTWLPAVSDESRWYRPDELAAAYDDYLFKTQAAFVGLPRPLQNAHGVNDLFRILGVQTTARTEQVVRHLLTCAGNGSTVNTAVYRHLNDNASEPALDELLGQPCILTPDGDYLRPAEIFRHGHPFGRFRTKLGGELHGYESLWERLGLRESPDASDAIDVLIDVGNEFGASNEQLDEEARSVVMAAWRMIEADLDQLSDADFARLKATKCIPDSRDVLLSPDRALFDDAPEYSDALHGHVGPMLIRKPEGAWRAMKRAGVGSLSEGVQIELHEATDEAEDTVVRNLLAERRLQIVRAIDPLVTSAATTQLSSLDELSFVKVSRLEVVYLLRLARSNAELKSELLEVSTVLVENRMLRAGDDISPVDLARELAKGVAPSVERTAIVPALALALQPGTPAAADHALDSAGIPRLDPAIASEVSPAVLEQLGGDDQVEAEEVDARAPVPGAAADRSTEDSYNEESEEKERQGEDAEREAQRESAGRRRRQEKRVRRTRLRSYVSPLGAETDGLDEGLDDGHNETDIAGIAAVLEYERSFGRDPKEMPHLNPGYDIESRLDGEVIRYIEVKSLSGEWSEYGAAVSGTQYRKATEIRDRFWLYVVERALSEPRIFPIHDPVGKTHEFMFDNEWKLVADARQHALPTVGISSPTTTRAVEGSSRVPLVVGDGDVIRGLSDEKWQGELVDAAAAGVRFVYRDSEDHPWLVGDAPHDTDRSGRLLLVEFLRDDSVELVVGWYRSFTGDGRIAIEVTSESDIANPIILFPQYEADVAILGEVKARGVVS